MSAVSVVAVIIALVIGGFVGSTITDNEADSVELRNQRGGLSIQTEDFKPESVDFVSTRPEVSNLPSESLSVVESDGLVFMREEEKLARDVYTTLYDQWGLRIFTNIAQSEQTHTEAVRDLLVKYGINDPVADDAVGVFANDVLQDLYNTLVAQGSVSELEALKVGALIEDLDIFDLKRYIEETDNADITLVYENLERGSRNHLRSFMSQIESRDGTYDAQYLTQAEFDEIKDSEKEKGGNESGGQGGGQGEGKGGRGWGN